MKTFFNLVQEVQKPGLCHRCCGCATFCMAIGYEALKINENGKPVYKDMEKCIECGLCYAVCPEISDLDEDIKHKAAWTEPMGRVIEITVARVSDAEAREQAADGGAITGLLLHLFDQKKIDGVVLTRPAGKHHRGPFLASTRKEIFDSAGLFLDTSNGMKLFGDEHMTSSGIQQIIPMIKKGLKRLALVGTPCQIKSLRKMQALNLIPSDSIKFCFGLFCSGNFTFGMEEQKLMTDYTGIPWEDVKGINIKDKLIVTMNSGEIQKVEFKKIESLKWPACRYCSDFSAEFADVSFGGVGSGTGWTTIITRTPIGRAVLGGSRKFKHIEQFSVEDNLKFASRALVDVRNASFAKKKKARHMRRSLKIKPVQVQI